MSLVCALFCPLPPPGYGATLAGWALPELAGLGCPLLCAAQRLSCASSIQCTTAHHHRRCQHVVLFLATLRRPCLLYLCICICAFVFAYLYLCISTPGCKSEARRTAPFPPILRPPELERRHHRAVSPAPLCSPCIS